ncbi:MAG: 50S ribosomal protein L21 [Spirochaetales bacterium]|nr:50S ribosomal protein L21 [Spirochaetales bacterium]
MYALVEIKGKQYKAEKGTLLRVDKIDAEEGSALEFDSVLMISGEGDVKVGAPYVDGASVKAKVEEHTKGKKIRIFRYKRRKNYARRMGHRQKYTMVRVEDILGV